MNVGLSIKKLRITNGLTQYQLAEILNVSMQTISRWETSVTYPDIFMLPILAKYFNVTVDSLLSDGGNVMKTIESDRLCIREWSESDAPALHELKLNVSYLELSTVNESLDIIKIWKVHQEMHPIILKETGELIGIVGLVDVNRYKGYRKLEVYICDKYHDVSHLTELHKLILGYGFNDLGILVAFAQCTANEEMLTQAMKNTGFAYEGTLRKFGRDMSDRMRYSITRDEFSC